MWAFSVTQAQLGKQRERFAGVRSPTSPRDHFCNPNLCSSSMGTLEPHWKYERTSMGPSAVDGRSWAPDGAVRPWWGSRPGEAQRIPQADLQGRAGPLCGLVSTGRCGPAGPTLPRVVAIHHQRPPSPEVDVFLPPVTHLSGASRREQGQA